MEFHLNLTAFESQHHQADGFIDHFDNIHRFQFIGQLADRYLLEILHESVSAFHISTHQVKRFSNIADALLGVAQQFQRALAQRAHQQVDQSMVQAHGRGRSCRRSRS